MSPAPVRPSASSWPSTPTPACWRPSSTRSPTSIRRPLPRSASATWQDTRPVAPEGTSSDLLQCDPGDAFLVANPGRRHHRPAGRLQRRGGDLRLLRQPLRTQQPQRCRPAAHLIGSATARPVQVARARTTPMPSGTASRCRMAPGTPRADDVVGHELTHGVTEFTSHLLYYFQSGAINESMSDIFGEFIDQQDGIGTDTPSGQMAARRGRARRRPPRTCRTPRHRLYPQPDKMTSVYWSAGQRLLGPGRRALQQRRRQQGRLPDDRR